MILHLNVRRYVGFSFCVLIMTVCYGFVVKADGDIVNTRHMKYTYTEMVEDINELQMLYPDYVHVNVVGVTADNRDIYDVIIGNPDAQKCVMFQASCHAREYMCSQLVMRQMEYYLDNYESTYDGESYHEIFDKVLGLELGADDYMIKPFDSKELVARVKAVLRRYKVPTAAPANIAPQSEYVEYPDLLINLTNYSVTYKGKNIDMPPKELELLYFLASSPNQVFTREQLLDHIWGYEYLGDTRTVDVHIKRIREKISDSDTWALSTVWGIGYKFETKTN